MVNLLEQFNTSLTPDEAGVLADAEEYVAWQVGRQETDFEFTNDDDIDLRSYLIHLRVGGVRRAELQGKFDSLHQLYDWAEAQELITYNPFADLDFNQPLLDSDEIQRRKETLPADPHDREMARLQALNELAQHLNQVADIESTLEVTLAKLVQVMNVPTAWIFLLPEIHTLPGSYVDKPPHDFALAAACGLPPGLEQDDRFFLCQPPDCHCQELLRRGRLTRAVNIVECTRCLDASKAGGDNRGLLFHASAPLIASGRSLGIINVATEEWQFFTTSDLQFLSTVGAQVAVTLDRARLYELTQAQRARMERELQMAREVQANLMPDVIPDIPGYQIAAFWESAHEVSGDFYDIFPLMDGQWAFIVADVCDKGAPAAMQMAMTCSVIRTHALKMVSPSAVLAALNDHLIRHISSSFFVTVFFGVIDPASGKLTYASAGHDPPLLRRSEGEIEQLMPTGPLIGIFDEIKIRDNVRTLSPGEIFVAYTDGVIDAVNSGMEEYGSSRLEEKISVATKPAILSEKILEDLRTFTGDTPQSDDITLLIVQREK